MKSQFSSWSLVCSAVAFANPEPSNIAAAVRAAVSPQVAKVQLIANVTDPQVTRDSCGSVKIGDRALWACRDTETWNNTSGQGELPLIANTASWTDFNQDGAPKIQTGPIGADSYGSNPILLMYGGHPKTYPTFYPILNNECPDSGVCDDGSRWAIWPNSPPMVTSTEDNEGMKIGYTWIPKAHLDVLTPLIPEPARTLYKITYQETSKKNHLRSVSAVKENFWKRGGIGYGDYGNVVWDGIAYLYGQTDSPTGTALAKAAVEDVEDREQYQYYVDCGWTKQQPGINDTAAIISNAGAGGQGTFYYSEYFSSYI
jgi:hypothetical protein